MSQDTKTLGINKKRSAEEGSKEYKKPKSLKQLTLAKEEYTPNIIPDTPKHKLPIVSKDSKKEICREDIIRVIDTLERVIARQDTAQGCLDRLIHLCLQEGHEDSSADEGVAVSKVL